MSRSASQLPESMKLKAPCADCPFREDMDFLSRERKIELVYALGRMGESFTCHKTLDYGEGQARYVPGVSNHCAGAMLFLDNIGHPNTAMQIGERLKFWSITDVHGNELVHKTIASFIGDDSFQTMRDVDCHERGKHER